MQFGQLAQVRVEEDDGVGLFGRHRRFVLGQDAVGHLAVGASEGELVVGREPKITVPRIPQQDLLGVGPGQHRPVDALQHHGLLNDEIGRVPPLEHI